MARLNALLRTQEEHRERIDFILSIANRDSAQPEDLVKGLEDEYEKARVNHGEIVNLCKAEQVANHRQAFNDLYLAYLDGMKVIRQRMAPAVPVVSSTPTSTCGPEIQLPRLSLPTFHGDVKEWISFSDLFRVSVTQNANLSDGQRMQYLKMSVKGEAAQLLNHMTIADANFNDAWALLESRYEDKREAIKQHLVNMLDQPAARTPQELRKLVDKCNGAQRTLTTLQVNQSDVILEFLILKKIPPEIRREWELSLSPQMVPTFKELLEFIERRAKAEGPSTVVLSQENVRKQSSFTTSNRAKLRCGFCVKEHNIYTCQAFLAASVPDRVDSVKKNGSCVNCLAFHPVVECKSAGRCKTCGGKHHSLLHIKKAVVRVEPEKTFHIQGSSTVLLSTAIVQLKGPKGATFVRALIDPGSTVDIVTERAIRNLSLHPKPSSISITGLQNSDLGSTKGTVALTVGSMFTPAATHSCNAFVVRSITTPKPMQVVSIDNLGHLKGLQLADPTFHEPGEIDLLIGVETYHAFRGNTSEASRGPPGTPHAEKTDLGWLISGPCPTVPTQPPENVSLLTTLDEQIERFWTLEKVPETTFLTKEEQECEDHFVNTIQRLDGGRFQVGLPLKQSPPASTRSLALVRLLALEKRFSKQQDYAEQYKDVIRDYEAQGHLVKVPEREISRAAVFLPHHGVTKESSTTTKLRVVFDGSASTKGEPSLNDCLMNGPKTQDDLDVILARFRTKKYAFTADIKQMYRQVKIRYEDQDLQRILWRYSQTDPITEYRLTTVTFGLKPAPFLATRTLIHLAEKESNQHPAASVAARRDIYVDNILTGADTIVKAVQLREDLARLLTAGGFHLREFAANTQGLLSGLPFEDVYQADHTFSDSEIKTLGVCWSPHQDVFHISVSPFVPRKLSKRAMLAETASIFDPLGWISPVTISAKILMQHLWSTECGWDDIVPTDIKCQWETIKSELNDLSGLNVPRYVPINETTQLIGFCDASESAYAAVIYSKTVVDGNVVIRLITAKTKVVPLKSISLPRLELFGALLLAHLAKATSKTLQITNLKAYCDSTVALAWIISHLSKWKTFERNRVAKIQEIIAPENWHFVKSQDNPADIASRESTTSHFIIHPIWWEGPPWLKEDFKIIPRPSPPLSTVDIALLKPTSISSDNATCFVAADRELKSYLQDRPDEAEITSFLAEQGISFSFIPPRAPHHGGIWEAAVKSAKRLLTRIVGTRPLNFEELATILIQIEAALNSRPLTALTQDVTSFEALTPGHFLIGAALQSAPDQDVSEIPENRLTRFQLVQQMTQRFWKQWTSEYLHTLTTRSKWKTHQKNLQPGDLVILKAVDSPPLHWPMARISQVHPGRDGHVRVVTVTTAAASYKRPISLVIPIFD